MYIRNLYDTESNKEDEVQYKLIFASIKILGYFYKTQKQWFLHRQLERRGRLVSYNSDKCMPIMPTIQLLEKP